MKPIEQKIRRAVETNKLSLIKLGERRWFNYFIRVTELVWVRNLRDGYQVEVYDKEYSVHLATIII